MWSTIAQIGFVVLLGVVVIITVYVFTKHGKFIEGAIAGP